jgi:sirohydrochlorin ferrochelatase
VHEAVLRARRDGARRVAVASYLLADGLFQQRLHNCGADLVSQPLGAHPGLARLIANRFRRAAPHTSQRPRLKSKSVERKALHARRADVRNA